MPLVPRPALRSDLGYRISPRWGFGTTRFTQSLVRQFEKRIEAHVVVGVGALAFVAEEIFSLLAMHLFQESLRAAEQAEPLQGG